MEAAQKTMIAQYQGLYKIYSYFCGKNDEHLSVNFRLTSKWQMQHADGATAYELVDILRRIVRHPDKIPSDIAVPRRKATCKT